MLVEVHMLKNYPPVNLNRDESGAPKSCMFGGTTRGRVSSQCLKRSWRKSPVLEEMIGAEHLGIRTRKLPDLVADQLRATSVSEAYIEAVLPKLSGFGNKEGTENKKGNITAQVVFYAPEDIAAVANVVAEKLLGCETVKQVKALKAKELQEAVKGADSRPVTLDMALFGRMVTSNAFRDVEAAMQVALLSGESMEEMGSAMIGDTDYNSSCYYIYASLDTDVLRENLKHSPDAEALIRKTIPALVRTMALTNPSGKQNSFAGNVLPSAILIECKEEKVPVSMVNAYVHAVRPAPENDYDLAKGSIQMLANQVDYIQDGFGLNVAKRLWFTQKPYEIHPKSEAVICASLPELVEEVAATLK